MGSRRVLHLHPGEPAKRHTLPGSTDNPPKRVSEHREKMLPGFTARYGVTMLVWFEPHETREAAFRRERRIKEWRRAWKLRLVEEMNPEWRDLYEELPRLIGLL